MLILNIMAESEKTKPVVVEMTDMQQSSPIEKEESTENNSGDMYFVLMLC